MSVVYTKVIVDKSVVFERGGSGLWYSCKYCSGLSGYPCYVLYKKRSMRTGEYCWPLLTSFLICARCYDVIRACYLLNTRVFSNHAGMVLGLGCDICERPGSIEFTLPNLKNLGRFSVLCKGCMQKFDFINVVSEPLLNFDYVITLGSEDVYSVRYRATQCYTFDLDNAGGVNVGCFRGELYFYLPREYVGKRDLIRYYFNFGSNFIDRVDISSVSSGYRNCWLCYGIAQEFYGVRQFFDVKYFLLCERCFDYLSWYDYGT